MIFCQLISRHLNAISRFHIKVIGNTIQIPRCNNDNSLKRIRLNQKTKVIQNWVKQNKDEFKQEDHDVQVVFDITTLEDGKEHTEENTKNQAERK